MHITVKFVDGRDEQYDADAASIELLSLLPPSMETPALLIGPVLVILGLFLLPFLSGEGEKSWKRRPIAVLTVILIAVTLGTFTHLAGYAPWSPLGR
jgi:ubiquinol-cytochrome c reductase cytochrome b subunit